MNEQLIFFSLSKDELQNIITNAVKQALETKQEKELMTFKETCELLNISASCLNQWKSQGKIPFKKLGKRIFFSRAEIANVLEEAGNYKKLRELR
jgi:excisionase family DNA binding protein